MRKRGPFALIAAVFTLVLAWGGTALAGEPYHLRLGWVVTPADLVTLMFVKPGLAPHAGKTYIPELTHFAGTPAEMTALATGELDCAALAYSTFALGIENAGMTDLRIIADEFQDGVPGHHTISGSRANCDRTIEAFFRCCWDRRPLTKLSFVTVRTGAG